MNSNQKLSYAICSILGLQAASAAHGAAAGATAESSEALGEIIVTAQRREENIQNVPITIQAMTSETIAQLNVVNLDAVIRYLPNVTQSTNGPGQGEIFMRGLSVGGGGNQGGGTTAAFPGVAIYLDEQSGQLPGRNLDVYAADLERIEVLEGPQGTQFGGGALAGVLRYITNKPKLNVTEGYAEAGYGTTAHGDNNSNATAVLNLPLIEDTLAVRGVIYNDHRGGYINNVAARSREPAPTSASPTQRRRGTDEQRVDQQQQPGRQRINPVSYQGSPRRALLQDQRRLERAADADLPEHGCPGRLLRDALRSEGAVLTLNPFRSDRRHRWRR